MKRKNHHALKVDWHRENNGHSLFEGLLYNYYIFSPLSTTEYSLLLISLREHYSQLYICLSFLKNGTNSLISANY